MGKHSILRGILSKSISQILFMLFNWVLFLSVYIFLKEKNQVHFGFSNFRTYCTPNRRMFPSILLHTSTYRFLYF